ncbi:MAG: cytochrome c biogenesis protein [Pyrobaculum sp.]|nr:cytochrome c biogenesis protein [Pyrobaculum sp.]
MKTATALLLLAALAAALQIGQLQFTDVKSQQDLAAALGRDGRVLIFIHQPDCPGCQYLKTQVFTDGRVASALKGINLVSIDLANYLVRGVEAVADGQVYIYYGGSLREQKVSGRQNIPVIGTPTVIMGYVKDGVLRVTFVMIGAADPGTFLKFLDMAYGQQTSTPQQQTQQPAAREGAQAFAQIALSFAAGVVSVFSPCVLPVLTIAATTYLVRRSLPLVLAGMAASYAVIATAVSAVAAWVGEVVNVVLYAVGGVLLMAMGAVLVVERLNKAFVIWASRFQTSAYKASKRGVGRAGDFMLGASLGAVWTPCIAPFFGAVVVANLVASALTGNYLLLFAATLAYAAGLALVIYLLIVAVRRGAGRAAKSMRWGSLGRKIEYAVGAASIILGVLLIGEALGLGTFSALFKL